MSVLHLGAIVEGHGEVRAAPILVHRVASEWDPTQTVIVKLLTTLKRKDSGHSAARGAR